MKSINGTEEPATSASGHAVTPQGDEEMARFEADFETSSFDGDFEALGMEFRTEDIVNTFVEAEALKQAGQKGDGQDSKAEGKPGDTNQKKRKKEGKVKGPSRRRKRDKGRPRRPLCGYNIFFQRHSKEIQGTTQFKDLGRIMGERWKLLCEEDRSVYEKEAEKDVIRFRREMDVYEKMRKERLCPSKLPPDLTKTGSTNLSTNPPSSSILSGPMWAASASGTILPSGFAPFTAPLTDGFAPGNPSLRAPNVLPVPGQQMGTPPSTVSLPHGTEIMLPDCFGVSRKYKVVYACYRMTEKEAHEYMARFASLTANHQRPMQQGPMQQGPMQQIPMQQIPMQQIPMQQIPTQQIPMHQSPMHQSPMQPQPQPTTGTPSGHLPNQPVPSPLALPQQQGFAPPMTGPYFSPGFAWQV
jgi:hypothetical protein